jgi:ATP-dependent RNA helicase DDX24/MAK5
MSFQKKKGKASRIWDGLPWNSVDVSKENLGDFEDAVFFGLEELDGNAYVLSKNEQGFAVLPSSGTNEREGKKPKKVKESPQDDIFGSGETNHTNQPSKRKSLKDIRKDAMKLKEGKTSDNKVAGGKLKHQKQKQSPVGQIPFDWPLEGEADWGGVKLHVLLQKSLISLNFNFPTPIQTAAIPLATKEACDVVGAAETGSGKTLAFGLPVLDGLLRNWDQYAMPNCPYAFIIAPTRELAMQITSVLKEVCSPFKSVRRVEVVNVVGGMSEQKQRRQLCWGSTGNKQSTGPKARPVHILVATPGRLCELLQDEDIAVFRDMSSVRFLVVDEADRIVEEGHFPEVSLSDFSSFGRR